MSKYKIVAFDLDGTTLDEDSKVSQENITAIKDMAKKGILPVVLTGRTFYEIPQELRDMEEIEYFIYSDGAVIFDRKKEKFFFTFIDENEVDIILNILFHFDCMIEIYANGIVKTNQIFLDELTFKHFSIEENYWQTVIDTRTPVKNIYNLEKDDVELINVFFSEIEEKNRCKKVLERMEKLAVTSSMQSNLEMFHIDTNKGNALENLANMLSINKEEIVAVGDSQNDLTTKHFAGTMCAVSNACNELKALSDKIICSNNEHALKYINEKII